MLFRGKIKIINWFDLIVFYLPSICKLQVVRVEAVTNWVFLFIGTAPSVFISPKYRTVREGNGLSLFCTATGKPKPRIRWKKNGKTITLDKRIRIRVNETGSKLRIKNSTIKDSGIYHCVAKLKNHHGYSTSEKAIVDVIGVFRNFVSQRFNFSSNCHKIRHAI